MVARRVLTWPDPALRKKSLNVDIFDASLKSLVSDLCDTLSVKFGAGLAAPQIGVHRRVVVIKCSSFGCENPMPDCNDDDWVLVNPVLECSSEKKSWKEACLSVPGYDGWVDRSSEVTVTYQDVEGKTHRSHTVWPLAGAVQHECDHLDGRLFLTHLSYYTRHSIEKKIRKKNKRIAELRAAAEEERKRELADIHGTPLPKKVRKKDPKRKRRAELAKISRKKNRKK